MAASERFQPLPAGTHGLDPQDVRVDQARRLREAMIELIAEKGYPAIRIADLARTAHVSPPTLYSLYADKEELFIDTYGDAARRTGTAILAAHAAHEDPAERMLAALRAFGELCASEPQAVSLLVQGAFGAGPEVLRKRRAVLETLESYIQSNRAPGQPPATGDLTVRALLGGIREVSAARLREGRHEELPDLAGPLIAWAGCYPGRLPDGLAAPDAEDAAEGEKAVLSPRARRAEGPLPSGRSDLPREAIEKSQQERIVDATAAIVAEAGLAGLTIPEITKRANVSNQTFYSLYRSKHDAFLGAQKVSLHQALRVTAEAYGAHPDDWPGAVCAGIAALLGYLASEPAHAHMTVVDTFAASPEAIRIRTEAIAGFRSYLTPGLDLPGLPAGLPGELAAESVVGGIWQILHDYIERAGAAALPGAAPQLGYFALAPFLGAERAAERALERGGAG
ncbi:MAG TPA: TetR/AcrR family transcriptional regulator [Solirubrobacteraceae bacterium]|nr:TetR/AcrR family transcriptional regulator [Solirubrobacteraceae bacterium]